MRLLRGTELTGLAGLKVRNVLDTELDPNAHESEGQISVVRPLLGLRREEVRDLLKRHGLSWCEDSSNQSRKFTRNRVRNELLPRIEDACGPHALDDLRAFGSAVESLETTLARYTAHLAWAPPAHAFAIRGTGKTRLGGTLERGQLMSLPRPLRRRALWRLLAEGPGKAPTRTQLELILDDLDTGRTTRRSLNGGWNLVLGASRLHWLPPGSSPPRLTEASRTPAPTQHGLPTIGEPEALVPPEGLRLPLCGSVALPDGRVLRAELVEPTPGSPVPTGAHLCELDATGLDGSLRVRWPERGVRFRPLGAPGSKRLFRFLADCGVPAAERRWVPLVYSGDELLWVAGIRLADARRVRARTTRRLRLELSS